MSGCPQQSLQALRWAFNGALQHATQPPSFAEFQSHFHGKEVPDSHREALHQLYAQFLSIFKNSCTEEFEKILRAFDIPQTALELDAQENCDIQAVQRVTAANAQRQQEHHDMLQDILQKLQSISARKAARIAALTEKRDSLAKQQGIDKAAMQLLCDWNQGVAQEPGTDSLKINGQRDQNVPQPGSSTAVHYEQENHVAVGNLQSCSLNPKADADGSTPHGPGEEA
eukprot:jgi/Ulvmu1/9385/UM051_0012.1